MKKWIFLILLFPLTCIAQTYQYIGVEDGLSNRRVYYIQKDRTGYMWSSPMKVLTDTMEKISNDTN